MRIFIKITALFALFIAVTACDDTKKSSDTGGIKNDVIQDIARDVKIPDEDIKQTEDTVKEILSDPGAEDPGNVSDPGTEDPGLSDPGNVSDPGATDPGLSDPGNVSDPGTTDPGTSMDVVADIPPAKRTGECNSSSDCGGHDCVELKKIGFNVCLKTLPRVFINCEEPKSTADECCSNMDCTDPYAGCYLTNHINYYGGGMPVEPHKICIADECSVGYDSDCDKKGDNDEEIPGICLPAGVNGWPKTRCITDYCARFGGCGNGEYCRVMEAPCVSGIFIGSFCASPATCESDADCKNGEQCIGDVKTGKTKCQAVYCPA